MRTKINLPKPWQGLTPGQREHAVELVNNRATNLDNSVRARIAGGTISEAESELALEDVMLLRVVRDVIKAVAGL